MRIFTLIEDNHQSSTCRTGDEVLNAHPYVIVRVCDDALVRAATREPIELGALGAPHRNALFFRQP